MNKHAMENRKGKLWQTMLSRQAHAYPRKFDFKALVFQAPVSQQYPHIRFIKSTVLTNPKLSPIFCLFKNGVFDFDSTPYLQTRIEHKIARTSTFRPTHANTDYGDIHRLQQNHAKTYNEYTRNEIENNKRSQAINITNHKEYYQVNENRHPNESCSLYKLTKDLNLDHPDLVLRYSLIKQKQHTLKDSPVEIETPKHVTQANKNSSFGHKLKHLTSEYYRFSRTLNTQTKVSHARHTSVGDIGPRESKLIPPSGLSYHALNPQRTLAQANIISQRPHHEALINSEYVNLSRINKPNTKNNLDLFSDNLLDTKPFDIKLMTSRSLTSNLLSANKRPSDKLDGLLDQGKHFKKVDFSLIRNRPINASSLSNHIVPKEYLNRKNTVHDGPHSKLSLSRYQQNKNVVSLDPHHSNLHQGNQKNTFNTLNNERQNDIIFNNESNLSHSLDHKKSHPAAHNINTLFSLTQAKYEQASLSAIFSNFGKIFRKNIPLESKHIKKNDFEKNHGGTSNASECIKRLKNKSIHPTFELGVSLTHSDSSKNTSNSKAQSGHLNRTQEHQKNLKPDRHTQNQVNNRRLETSLQELMEYSTSPPSNNNNAKPLIDTLHTQLSEMTGRNHLDMKALLSAIKSLETTLVQSQTTPPHQTSIKPLSFLGSAR